MAVHPLGSVERPLRVAVIGAGPSGFYAIQALHRLEGWTVTVDLFDRLPTPYGLVRGGVAPDHQTIKKVTAGYEKLALTPGVRFFGNVRLGRDLAVEDLTARYDAVVYAVGNESDRKLGIPGEDLVGVHSATEFVYWYNAHPDYADRTFALNRAQRVAVIGNGNVAIDVARVLGQPPERLAVTDISMAAVETLQSSTITEVLMLGRRGPAQAAFSPKEIKELGTVEGMDLVVTPRYMELEPDSQAWLEQHNEAKTVAQNLEFLNAQAARGEGDTPRKVRCWFRVSPVAFIGDESGRLTHIRLVRNDMVLRNGRISAVPSDEVWDEEVQLVFKAIGYRGVPIPGVPFDEDNGIIANIEGRVVDADTREPRPGEYVVGWAKRGPSGLIGTNRADAKDVIELLRADLGGTSADDAAPPDIAALLRERGVAFASFQDWLALDRVEVERGRGLEKIREKVSSVDEMLQLIEEVKG